VKNGLADKSDGTLLCSMKRFSFVLWLVIGLLIGGTAGWFAAGRYYSRWAQQFVSAGALPELGDAYHPLKALRAGDTNEAIDLLEIQLDGAIIQLSAMVPEERDEKMKAAYVRALTRVREYRAAYPRKTGIADLDEGVVDALSSFATNKVVAKP
jgi:hypothetical protein